MAEKVKQLSKVLELSANTLKVVRQYALPLFGIVLVAALPAAILKITTDASDPIIGAYLSLLAVLMNLALLYAAKNAIANKAVTLKAAYYIGTAYLVKTGLISLVLILQLIPLMLAISVALGLAPGDTLASIGEKILLGSLSIVLAIPTIYLLPRYFWALFLIQDPKLTPVLALRASRKLVEKRFLAVAGRLVFGVVVTLVVLAIPEVVGLIAEPTQKNQVLLALLEVGVNLITLPCAFVYGYILFGELGQS